MAAIVQFIGNRNEQAEKVAESLNLFPVPATALVLFIVLASVMPQLGLQKVQLFKLYQFIFLLPLLLHSWVG